MVHSHYFLGGVLSTCMESPPPPMRKLEPEGMEELTLEPTYPHLTAALALRPDLPLCPLCPQFRNPKASLRVRLCDLLGHLQRSNERDCQEFYRALYIHAQPLHSCLPSRRTLRKCTSQSSGLSINLLWPHLILCSP